jgi:endoglycosylceramidase
VRRVLGIALALVVALTACAIAAGPKGPLGHSGRWMTDARGRAVVLHGVNMVYKLPPYAPRSVGFNGPDARFLHRHGFNTVRLGLIYAGVEPKPGHYDDRYLRRIAKTERVLARNRIFSLLDFHQDLFNEKFSGEGFPAWAVLDGGLPAEPLTGFPGTYISSPGGNQSWNSLWLDSAGPGGVGLQERYAAAWKHVADRFRKRRRVLGYDIINEPWPGTQWPTCANTQGCPAFEQNFLGPMEKKAIDAIRTVDHRHIVWYEPVVTSQFGTAYTIPDSGDPNAGMSFHDYCLSGALGIPAVGGLSCPELESLSLDNARQRADLNGDTLMLSEWGATADKATIKRMVDATDQRMLSWQWWHYCGCADPTTSGPGDAQAIVKNAKKPPRGKNVLRGKLKLIERPYPQAVAGTPTSYSYDRDANAFSLKYSTKDPAGKRLPRRVKTVVYVPRIHYRHGYSVAVKGARVVSREGARYLVLQRGKRARTVSVSVGP